MTTAAVCCVALWVAAAPAPLQLREVLEQIELRHPSATAAEAERALAAGDLLAADGAFDPIVTFRSWAETGTYDNAHVDVGLAVPTQLWGATLNGGYRYGVGTTATYDKYDATSPLGEARAGISLPLARGGAIDRRRATVARLRLEQDVARHGAAAVLLDLKRAAAGRYWEWVARGERLRIAEDLERLAAARAEQLQARVAVGDLPDIERVDNERLVASRRQRVIAARRSLEQAAFELALFTRDDSGDPVAPPSERLPRLQAPPPSRTAHAEVLQRALAQRPELLRLQRQREQADVELAQAANLVWPGLDVFAEVAQNLGAGSALGSTDVVGGLAVELPTLFRVGRGRESAARAARVRAEAHLRLAADRVALEVDDAWSALVAADERVVWAEREVLAARAVEAAERARFAGGDSTILQVNLREQALADARAVAVDALLDAWRARVQLEAVAGDAPSG